METLAHKLANVEAKALVDTLAHTLAEIEMRTLGYTMAEVEAKVQVDTLREGLVNKVASEVLGDTLA